MTLPMLASSCHNVETLFLVGSTILVPTYAPFTRVEVVDMRFTILISCISSLVQCPSKLLCWYNMIIARSSVDVLEFHHFRFVARVPQLIQEKIEAGVDGNVGKAFHGHLILRGASEFSDERQPSTEDLNDAW